MAQTNYDIAPKRAFAGLTSRGVPDGVRTGLNEESSAVGFGLGVKPGAGERGFATFDAVTDKFLGVTMHKHRSPGLDGTVGIPADVDNPILEQGDVWVRCEEAIALGDRVFCRAVAGGEEVLGEFRNDADGTANLWTGTPSAENDTDYSVRVLVDGKEFEFTVTSDTNGTETEIVTALKAAMAADTEFTSYVTAGGTTTLTLTAVDKSKRLFPTSLGSAGAIAWVETDAAAPDCLEVPNAEWVSASITGADGETLALLRLK